MKNFDKFDKFVDNSILAFLRVGVGAIVTTLLVLVGAGILFIFTHFLTSLLICFVLFIFYMLGKEVGKNL